MKHDLKLIAAIIIVALAAPISSFAAGRDDVLRDRHRWHDTARPGDLRTGPDDVCCIALYFSPLDLNSHVILWE